MLECLVPFIIFFIFCASRTPPSDIIKTESLGAFWKFRNGHFSHSSYREIEAVYSVALITLHVTFPPTGPFHVTSTFTFAKSHGWSLAHWSFRLTDRFLRSLETHTKIRVVFFFACITGATERQVRGQISFEKQRNQRYCDNNEKETFNHELHRWSFKSYKYC